MRRAAANPDGHAARGAGVQTARVKREVLGKNRGAAGTDDVELSAASRWLARFDWAHVGAGRAKVNLDR